MTSPASPAWWISPSWRDNDFNLNIRRYVDNTPPPEPQDVRAHLHGGVPKAEVRAHEGRFAAYGIDVHSLFTERDGDYYDFPPVGWQQAADQIPALAAPKEAELHEAFDDWWHRHVKHIIELPDTKQVMDTRKDLLDSFVTALEPLGVLDRFQLAGVIASWWGEVQYDIRTLAFHRFSGVVQGWLTTIEAAFADDEDDDARDKQKRDAEKRKAREHRVVPVLIPDYLNALEEAEARRAELEAQVKAATATQRGRGRRFRGNAQREDLKKLKARPGRRQAPGQAARKQSSSTACAPRHASSIPSPRKPSSSVFSSPTSKIASTPKSRLAAAPLSSATVAGHDKYAATLRDLQARRDTAAARLSGSLEELGYV